jgi:hypothetical protein
MKDYTDFKNKLPSASDIIIISNDDNSLYYDRNILSKFVSGVSEGKSGGVPTIKMNHPSFVINLFLNHISNNRLLETLDTKDLSFEHAWVLHESSKKLGHEGFAKIAKSTFLNLSYPVTQTLIDRFRDYDKENKDSNEKQLFAAIDNGTRIIDGKVDRLFLSDCFEYMIKSSCNNRKHLFRTILPIYEPTPEQLKMFTLREPDQYPRMPDRIRAHRNERIADGIGKWEYIDEFMTRCMGNEKNITTIKRLFELIREP